MAKMTAKKRSSLPSSSFAGPGRSFPVNDKAHAVAALRLVGRAVKAGNISSSQADRIRARARSKLKRASGSASKSS